MIGRPLDVWAIRDANNYLPLRKKGLTNRRRRSSSKLEWGRSLSGVYLPELTRFATAAMLKINGSRRGAFKASMHTKVPSGSFRQLYLVVALAVTLLSFLPPTLSCPIQHPIHVLSGRRRSQKG